jgi:hypothetical protein
MASAALASICSMAAWAWGLRTNTTDRDDTGRSPR